MRIGLRATQDLLIADVARPDEGVSQEEALIGCEAELILLRLAGRSLLEGLVSDLQTAEVGQRFAERELAVGVYTGRYVDAVVEV